MAVLPIHALEGPLVDTLRQSPRLILSAPTGSGKSTQVPQILLRHGFLETGQVVVLQPRRLATRLLAKRVAEELGVELGTEVGYQIRFENVAGPETRIKFVTEGVLLRQLLDRPRLDGISAIIFDEFHERHLYGDVTLARALQLQKKERPDLRLVVMSATLDTQTLSRYLDPCTVLNAEGRHFPVEIEYADKPAATDERPVWERAAEAFAAYHSRVEDGDTLIFMPGAYEIQRTIEALSELPETRGMLLLPLHGELPTRDQDKAVARHDRRKIVVATNVAETSLTIDGIRLVIDSGLARLPKHDPWRGINTLLIENISRASAEQRAGRAGRTAPGLCVRLWSAEEHAQRPEQELPEIKRLDLSEMALTLKAADVEVLSEFPWLEAPDARSLAHAEDLLRDLGALEPVPGSEDARRSRVTDIGRRMLTFPVHPRYARLLIAAEEQGCVYHGALIAALTQGRDLLLRNIDRDTARRRDERLGTRAKSDFLQWIRAWEYASEENFRTDACQKLGIHAATARQVAPLLKSFLKLAERAGMDVTPRELDEARLGRCVLAGFSDHIARRLDSGTLRCELRQGRRGVLARESVVQDSPLLVAAEVREVGGRDGETSIVLSLTTAIQPQWLVELFPADVSRETKVYFDTATRRVIAEERLTFRGLPVEVRRVEPPPVEAAAKLLADEIFADRLTLPGWDHSVEQWILRLNWLAKWCPELELPPITDADRRELLEQICHGAFSYKEIKDRPVAATVKAWLNPAQQELLDQHAPERLNLPNGRKPKVTYTSDGQPFIAMRVQELFGTKQLPRIAQGRVALTLHILAPNMRAVQITQDLHGFWREHYPKVKSELQRKYPKHEWR